MENVRRRVKRDGKGGLGFWEASSNKGAAKEDSFRRQSKTQGTFQDQRGRQKEQECEIEERANLKKNRRKGKTLSKARNERGVGITEMRGYRRYRGRQLPQTMPTGWECLVQISITIVPKWKVSRLVFLREREVHGCWEYSGLRCWIWRWMAWGHILPVWAWGKWRLPHCDLGMMMLLISEYWCFE